MREDTAYGQFYDLLEAWLEARLELLEAHGWDQGEPVRELEAEHKRRLRNFRSALPNPKEEDQ